MLIFYRYISVSVMGGFLLIALIIVSLFSVILLIEELDQVGTGSYHWALAMRYVLFHAPKVLLDFAAFIGLLGSIMALGALAGKHELVALESLGVSPRRITHAVLFAALVLMALVLVNAQYLIPYTLQKAHAEKILATESSGDFIGATGYWAQSNHRFIHIREIKYGRVPANIEIYEFNQQHQLRRYLHAQTASLISEVQWQLQNVTIKERVGKRLIVRPQDLVVWDSFLSASQLGVIVSRPEALSITHLYRYIKGLKDRNEQSYRAELLFWQKIIIPISAAIMILLGLPFVFGSQRHVSTGKRITFGVLAGLAFYIASQLLNHTGALLQWPPLAMAILPSAVVLTILILLRLRSSHGRQAGAG